MKRGISGILICTALLVALLLLGWFNLSKPRILVLHSGDRQSLTVKKMDQGIRQELEKNRQPLSVRWHYLGMERLPDEARREDAAREGKRTVEQFDPDVIIAVDDEAQQYVTRAYAGHSRPKIIFAAIDHEPQTYGYVGAANVTGVLEKLPLVAIRDILLQSHQGKPVRLAVLGQPSQSGKGQVEQIKAFDWGPHKLVETHMLADFAAWQAAIQAMEGKVDAVLVLSTDGLPTGPDAKTLLTSANVVSWIEKNAKPLPLGLNLDYVVSGGGLSVSPSGRAMGEIAATETLAWLKARPGTAPTPIIESRHYSVALRASSLQARGVTLPSIYSEAARLHQFYFP